MDGILFVGIAGGGLAVLDIADPRATQIIATLAMPGSELVDLALVETTLYAADLQAGVHTIDVRDPRQPRAIATHPALAYANNRRVAAADDLLVLVNDHAITIFDIARRDQPPRPLAVHTRLRTAVGWLRGVVLERRRLHVTQGPIGVWTFDLADPTRPQSISGLEPRLDTRPNERLICDALAQLGERIFVGTSSGIWSLRLPATGAAESESFYTGPGTLRDNARGVVRDGQLFFCAAEPHDHVFHIFDPSQGAVRYMGRQRLSRMIERIYDLEVGAGFWIGAAGNAGVLFAAY